MPISSSAASAEKKKEFRIRGKTSTVDIYDQGESTHKNFLTIGPALPSPVLNNDSQKKKVLKRSLSTLSSLTSCTNYNNESDPNLPACIHTYPDGSIHVSRNQKAKEKNPDRICLDRRGFSTVPVIDGESQLRLLSLQHNLLSNLDGLQEQHFSYLVFLDVYDNQLEKITNLDTLENLRVLLMGKNRIKRIEGLQHVLKLEVLDLHGNQITQVNGLFKLSDLKVLNLAGNQIRSIGIADLRGLVSLQELNLRRNRLRKLLGFGDTMQLQKLFLSNNEIQSVEDMSSVAKAVNLREVAIDNNPVSLGGECVSFLVSYLPQLCLLSNMQITEQVRKAAMAWRRNKETSNAAFMDLTSDVCLNVHREEIISNARTNWELLRSQTRNFTFTKTSNSHLKDIKIDSDFILTPMNKPEIRNNINHNNNNNNNNLTNNNSGNNINHNLLLINRQIKVEKRSGPVGKMNLLPDKKLNITRSLSQDTDNLSAAQITNVTMTASSSSSVNNNNDLFRLPPILVPIINKLENTNKETPSGGLKRWGSLSSLGPNVDSSSFPSSASTSDNESEKDLKISPKITNSILPLESNNNNNVIQQQQITATSSGNTDTSSTISTATSGITVHSSSASCSEFSQNVTSNCRSHVGSKTSLKRNIKSASNLRHTNGSKMPNSRAATANSKSKMKITTPSPPPPPPPPSKDREQGGDYLIEICGRYLNVYGHGALRFIDKSWNTARANDVHTVKFRFINFNNIVGSLSKIKIKFPNVDSLVFCETNIDAIGQLNALAEVQGFTSLKIEADGNPISLKNWRSYAIYRLSHWGLKLINDIEVSENEIKLANEEYQNLSELVLASLPDVLLQPLLTRLQLPVNEAAEDSASNINAKQWLYKADPALRSVVSKEALQWRRGSISQEDLAWRQKAQSHISTMIDSVCDTVYKLRLLDKEWPVILPEILKEILLDYSQLDVYMKKKLNELNS